MDVQLSCKFFILVYFYFSNIIGIVSAGQRGQANSAQCMPINHSFILAFDVKVKSLCGRVILCQSLLSIV